MVVCIKGELLNVPRDNVIYEAGLFGGHLGTERCFMVVPQTIKVRVPTDLLGMTLGVYEDDRTDWNHDAAVAAFCMRVKKRITSEGPIKTGLSEELREVAAGWDFLSLIKDRKEQENMRLTISQRIEALCRVHRPNKRRLLLQHRTGFYLALLAAIRFSPERSDWELILAMRPKQLPPYLPYYKLLEAIEELRNRRKVTLTQLRELHDWANKLPDVRKYLAAKLDALGIIG